MNICIWCRVVLSILLCLYETRVVHILVLAFECTKIDVNGGMSIYDCDHDDIKECDVWEIDGHNGWGALL